MNVYERSIVHEHVDPTKLVENPISNQFRTLGLGHIRYNIGTRPTARCELIDGVMKQIFVPHVVKCDDGASFAQSPANGISDATSRTCDYGNFGLKWASTQDRFSRCRH
jgi:hypothetical protein